MSTIGSLVMATRRKIPDPVPFLPAPTATFTVNPGGSLPVGAYFLKVTQLNAYGETLPSVESAQQTTTTSNKTIQVTSQLLPGATTLRVYMTLVNGVAGSEIGFQDFQSPMASITAFPTQAGQPPISPSAALPDSDGQAFSANVMFGWLNDALNKLSHVVGGILDYCGVPTQSGQSLYVIPGQWLTITDVWYGGYWIKGGKRAEYFRRNLVTSNVLQMATISITSDKQVIEVTYQPDRNSGITALTADIGSQDTNVPVANTSAFLLPFGFAQIGTEIVAYAGLGNATSPGVGYGQGGYGGGGYGGGGSSIPSMIGLIRGVGNTVAQAWPNTTPVIELSLFWNGRRIFNTPYAPGQSAVPLPIPYGWVTILQNYMLAQAKMAEQDMAEAAKLEKAAYDAAIQWMYSNKEIPTGVQVGGNNNPLVYNNTPAGGILIP